MAEATQTLNAIQDAVAEIKVDPSRISSEIDPKIYSGFVEHLGRCVYNGGLVDFDNKTAGLTNEKGYRLDVADALKQLDMPVVRYPGGNFVSAYHWMDGVGPKENRPRRPELAWLTEESNQFGTDEFMEWCEFMKVEPYMCLNMGTGTLDEALAWVEYCNSDANTYYANLRRKNGHEKPYNVKYWGLGNEVYGEWQVGSMTAEDYCIKAGQWARALKLLDPNIKLVSCGQTGVDNWDHTVTKELIPYIDFHSIHTYTYHKDYYTNVFQPLAAERAIQITSKLLELAKITRNVPNSKATIAFDEWNVWDMVGSGQEVGLEQAYDFSDAIAVATWLHVFVRQSRHVGMANLAQCVNAIAPIVTNKNGMFLQTIYQPFKLFSQHMRGKTLALHIASPVHEGSLGDKGGSFSWLNGIQPDFPYLQTSATVNGKLVTVAVTNVSLDHDIKTEIRLDGKYESKIKRWTLYNDDIRAKNSFDKPEEVKVSESIETIESNTPSFTFKKHSFNLLQFKLE
jgi:alpha-N-arabinofuranosidase